MLASAFAIDHTDIPSTSDGRTRRDLSGQFDEVPKFMDILVQLRHVSGNHRLCQLTTFPSSEYMTTRMKYMHDALNRFLRDRTITSALPNMMGGPDLVSSTVTLIEKDLVHFIISHLFLIFEATYGPFPNDMLWTTDVLHLMMVENVIETIPTWAQGIIYVTSPPEPIPIDTMQNSMYPHLPSGSFYPLDTRNSRTLASAVYETITQMAVLSRNTFVSSDPIRRAFEEGRQVGASNSDEIADGRLQSTVNGFERHINELNSIIDDQDQTIQDLTDQLTFHAMEESAAAAAAQASEDESEDMEIMLMDMPGRASDFFFSY